MKKIYIAIVCIALALFVSCDEKKAKDEIKKALDKTVEEKDKATPKLNKPAINSQRARVGTAVTFPKVEGYSYELKQAVNGVTLNVSDKNTGEVRATEAASGIIIVATKDGTSIESNPIEFVIIVLTKPAINSQRVTVGTVVSFPKVLGHTYELKEEKTGVTLSEANSERMQVRATQAASNVIIVATLDGRTSESNPIKFIELTKPAINSQRVKVGTAVTFPKVEGHTYSLKDPTISGVSLELSSERMGEVRATEALSNVIIVATLDGNSIDSDPIEFIEIIKPTFSPGASAPWNTPPITFPKIPGYSYALKEKKTGVTLSEAASNTMEVAATQSAQNVIIVVTDNGLNEDSDPIEFTRIPGNTLSFAQARRTQKWTPSTVTFTQTATKSRTVAGDTRNIRYSTRCRDYTPESQGVRLNSNTGQVTIRGASAIKGTCTITAELPQTAKYERSTATYTLVIN